ncbi:alpha/beta fold hydrolase [Pseudomonas sp. KK4]|uniref:alpha/beta fold hydrolase n=1 Tax=Pseudomonas sp. KK4 TaxID=1855729 RepID=UPI00097CAAC0|nr:alpha/beta hydrolase [Pseudomonas sp. KK4]
MSAIKHVILVHGAWADSTSWDKVRARLESAGISTTTVNLPLTSLAADAAAVSEVIAASPAPALLVGHSYGGAVISQAGGHPNVAGLVYINAFTPDIGESALGLTDLVEPSLMSAEIRGDDAGNLSLTYQGVYQGFAQDVSDAEKHQLFTRQRPTAAAALSAPLTHAAWQNKPSWYLVASLDNAIPPALQERLVKKIGAVSDFVDAGHCSMISQPTAVAELIVRAAR